MGPSAPRPPRCSSNDEAKDWDAQQARKEPSWFFGGVWSARALKCVRFEVSGCPVKLRTPREGRIEGKERNFGRSRGRAVPGRVVWRHRTNQNLETNPHVKPLCETVNQAPTPHNTHTHHTTPHHTQNKSNSLAKVGLAKAGHDPAKHPQGHKPCFYDNVASLATFSPKNTDSFVCPARSFSLLFSFCLSWFFSMCCFPCFILFFAPWQFLLRPHFHGS